MSTVRIQLRRGNATQWTAANPTLRAGEIGLELDTSKQKIGDGVTSWNALSYAPRGPEGPAGPAGPSGDAVGLPTGGDPGNILMKTTYANYESNWAATLDGGTFN
jgi:hypothetical protein